MKQGAKHIHLVSHFNDLTHAMNTTATIAVIGLGTMGAALARNIEKHGYIVSVFNRDSQKTTSFLQEYKGNFITKKNYKALFQDMQRPRKIILMVKAGNPVDDVIKDILPFLHKEDIIIDGGNSHYTDTKRRQKFLQDKGIHFVGMGVSGGEEGALNGPSLMPGCSREAWKSIKPILTKIAATDFSGKPCVTHIGENGSGHYVKMIHNAIEYGIMELIAETYDIFKKIYKLKPNQISDIYETYNKRKLTSFLFEISAEVLKKKDTKNTEFLVEKILDKAEQKGTGKWTGVDALDRGVSVPTLVDAVFARCVSAEKEKRITLSNQYRKKTPTATMPIEVAISSVEDALYAAIISIYAQGYNLMIKAAQEEQWNINYSEINRIWQGGCIIRSDMLRIFERIYKKNRKKDFHLFEDQQIQLLLQKYIPKLRSVVTLGISSSIPITSFTSALQYTDAITSATLPANIIQGLRDYFGAHTYERIDKKGTFHTNWKDV